MGYFLMYAIMTLIFTSLLTQDVASQRLSQPQRLPGLLSPAGPARFANPTNMLGQISPNFGGGPIGPSGINSLRGPGFNPVPFTTGVNSMFGPGRFHPHGNHNYQQMEIYTAIGKDPLDQNSQMRLTITERRTNFNSFISIEDEDGFDTPTSWYVQGTFLNSQLSNNKGGSYYLVLTTSGRTADGCDSTTLGNIVTTYADPNNPFLQFPASGPSAVLPNPLLIGTGGPTVYSSTLDGVSRRQLLGAGIAACRTVHNGICGGYIPFCATVSKDTMSAMELPMTQNSQGNVVPFTTSLQLDGNNGLSTGLGGTGLGFGGGSNVGGLGIALANSETPQRTESSDLFS